MNPRQYLLQGRKELLPPALGALVGLLLIRLEARLLHAHVGLRARRGESPSDDTLETKGRPRVRQRFIRLDCQDLTVNNAPVCAKIETVVHDRLEVVLHQPLLDQVSLSESAPDLFRRMRYLTFDNDGERFGRLFVHWSILFSRSSRWSNRLCQNPAIWLVQSIRPSASPHLVSFEQGSHRTGVDAFWTMGRIVDCKNARASRCRDLHQCVEEPNRRPAARTHPDSEPLLASNGAATDLERRGTHRSEVETHREAHRDRLGLRTLVGPPPDDRRTAALESRRRKVGRPDESGGIRFCEWFSRVDRGRNEAARLVARPERR